jgi:hypothetical protein
MVAANSILKSEGLKAEPLFSVPMKGLFAK